MSAKFQLKKASDEKFMFNLKAANGEIILTSQTYTAKPAALTGIESVRTNGSLEERYERLEAKDGSPYFVLKAANGNVIGKSGMYASAAAMETGINSVKTNCGAEIDDQC